MDEPLVTPRCAYSLVWLLRPPSRRGAGVEASGGEMGGYRFCSKSHGARRAGKNSDTPTGTIRAYLNIFQRFLQR